MTATPPRRRLALAVGLVTGAMLLAVLGALGLGPVVSSAVDGLRSLGGAGVDPPGHERPAGLPDDVQAAVVERVVDGDTVRVRVTEAGGTIPRAGAVRVRLLNVDAPELDHPERGEDCGAAPAGAFVAALLPVGSTVYLAADTEDRDHYDRPLRAAWNEDGRFVNAELVAAGWAEVLHIPPNDRFLDGLVTLEATARAEGRGIWSACRDR